MNSKIALLLSR